MTKPVLSDNLVINDNSQLRAPAASVKYGPNYKTMDALTTVSKTSLTAFKATRSGMGDYDTSTGGNEAKLVNVKRLP